MISEGFRRTFIHVGNRFEGEGNGDNGFKSHPKLVRNLYRDFNPCAPGHESLTENYRRNCPNREPLSWNSPGFPQLWQWPAETWYATICLALYTLYMSRVPLITQKFKFSTYTSYVCVISACKSIRTILLYYTHASATVVNHSSTIIFGKPARIYIPLLGDMRPTTETVPFLFTRWRVYFRTRLKHVCDNSRGHTVRGRGGGE